MKKLLPLVFVLMLGATLSDAQTADADKAAQYTKTITGRADKIVAKLGITDSVKYKKMLAIIVDQYRAINDIHDARNAQVKAIKEQAGDDKAAATAKAKAIDDELEVKTNALHTSYLAKLIKELSADKVEKVKDEMTYNLVAITYNAYLAEVLTLTDAQKAQIKAWLIEAREHAIDAESSNKKHEVFGKYKGRINNYLSAQGYDMKKEGEEWQKRIKESSNKP
jgi:Spy/CpxP family protein refolding chaperone